MAGVLQGAKSRRIESERLTHRARFVSWMLGAALLAAVIGAAFHY